MMFQSIRGETHRWTAVPLDQTELFANGSILTPFFGVEKWTADSPSGENHRKTRVSLLLRCLL